MNHSRHARIMAGERFDVLETDLPRGSCSVKGCERTRVYPLAGEFGTFYVCSRHLPLYREHRRIVARIRSL